MYDSKITPRLKRFDIFLEKNDFLNNGKLCFYDFYFYEILQVIAKMYQPAIENLLSLNRYTQRVAELEGVKDYLNSDRFDKNLKFFGPATWRG